ncbi:MAG: hypothetical protein OP8BY_0143 [Candidatus Saccharicenans subterraneus]|uniref:Peptidase M14 domain-containing protein n=1 Tax=Candidatus Saccharicenans subterraneus TaxID=2508984 RepID=A0A3E2BIU9_9BACT|nr:MAG: hypothetical protein OP8BY_0143 [Candidatus Saccharicenans subterraneum]
MNFFIYLSFDRRRVLRSVGLLLLAGLVLFLSCSCSSRSGDREAGQKEQLPALSFDHIPDYEELTRLLHNWAASRPEIMDLHSIGQTPGGRNLWWVTITNKRTGSAGEKPALMVDGNMHALEWIGGMAALNFIRRLLEGYGRDALVTKLVDTRTVYVLSRVSPDGVEMALKEKKIIRSALRISSESADENGLYMKDIDGDGRIVFMRYKDRNGPWKPHPSEGRLMVSRLPQDLDGEFWRVLPEGLIDGFDGENIKVRPALEGIDFGVFFPDDRFLDEVEQQNEAGYELVPEVLAYVRELKARPNIFAHVTCHSFGGAILMPPVNEEEKMPSADRAVYDFLAGKASDLTGYEAITYLSLRGGQNLDKHISTEIGWLYNVRGIFSFVTEFWNPLKAAGITVKGPMSLWLGGFHPVEDELKLLGWNDQELGGQMFVRWHPFDHPQLGKVEIGGWDLVNYFYNVPPEKVEKEIAPHADWLILLGLSSPRLEIGALTAKNIGQDRWQVRLVVENSGWLPTYGSQKVLDNNKVDEVSAEIELDSNLKLTGGPSQQKLGHLSGRSQQRSTATWWGYEPGTADRAVVVWNVSGPAGGRVNVTVRQSRAGTVRKELILN